MVTAPTKLTLIDNQSSTDRVSNWNPNLDLWPWPTFPGELWSWPTDMHKVKVEGHLIQKLQWK